jgi:hypothetical protein
MSNQRWVAAIVVVAVLVGGSFGIGYAVADSANTSTASPSFRSDRLATMMNDGSLKNMVQGHVQMLNRIRGSLSPELQALMGNDAMTKLMLDGQFQSMMHDHTRLLDETPGMHGGGGMGG